MIGGNGWCGWPGSGGGSPWLSKTWNAGDMAMLEGVPYFFPNFNLPAPHGRGLIANQHDTNTFSYMTHAMPENWDLGAIYLQLYFLNDIGDPDVVEWEWWATAQNDGEAYTTPLPAFVPAYKAAPVADLIYITPEVSFVPANDSGANKPGDLVTVGLYRSVDAVTSRRPYVVKVRMRYKVI